VTGSRLAARLAGTQAAPSKIANGTQAPAANVAGTAWLLWQRSPGQQQPHGGGSSRPIAIGALRVHEGTNEQTGRAGLSASAGDRAVRTGGAVPEAHADDAASSPRGHSSSGCNHLPRMARLRRRTEKNASRDDHLGTTATRTPMADPDADREHRGRRVAPQRADRVPAIVPDKIHQRKVNGAITGATRMRCPGDDQGAAVRDSRIPQCVAERPIVLA
jgi:hypothetical protein